MTTAFVWNQATYAASFSSRCWWSTPYDDGWTAPGLAEDAELQAIVRMEYALGAIPAGVARVVETSIRSMPPCGHCRFPLPFLETISAIGAQRPQPLIHTCYTIDSDQKKALADYCLALDAWLAGAPPEAPARELATLGHRRIAWDVVCADLWAVLGEHTELKDLLVERTLLQTRWWIKSCVWDDDRASRFGRDQYLGTYRPTGSWATECGNHDLVAPTFDLAASPRIRRMEARLAELSAEWPWFRNLIVDGSWPCAPKTFRFLERLLWSIGRERPAVSLPSYPLAAGEEVPDFLQAEDTCPAPDQAARWWVDLVRALDGWWQGAPAQGEVAEGVYARLGQPTNVKRWLVRLYAHRLRHLARHGNKLGLLVNPQHPHKWGSAPLACL